jgi:hypothetical protein
MNRLRAITRHSLAPHRVKLFVSGGAPGADMGGLKGAKAAGIPTAGYVPKNFDPTIAQLYGLENSGRGHGTKDQYNIDRHLRGKRSLLIAHRSMDPRSGRGTSQTRNYALYKTYAYFGEKKENTDETHTDPRLAFDYAGRRFNLHVSGDIHPSIPVLEMFGGICEGIDDITPESIKNDAVVISETIRDLGADIVMITGPAAKSNCERVVEEIYRQALQQ